MIHYIKRLIKSSHAFEIDAAVKKPGPVEAAAEHGPVEPVLPVS